MMVLLLSGYRGPYVPRRRPRAAPPAPPPPERRAGPYRVTCAHCGRVKWSSVRDQVTCSRQCANDMRRAERRAEKTATAPGGAVKGAVGAIVLPVARSAPR